MLSARSLVGHATVMPAFSSVRVFHLRANNSAQTLPLRARFNGRRPSAAVARGAPRADAFAKGSGGTCICARADNKERLASRHSASAACISKGGTSVTASITAQAAGDAAAPILVASASTQASASCSQASGSRAGQKSIRSQGHSSPATPEPRPEQAQWPLRPCLAALASAEA